MLVPSIIFFLVLLVIVCILAPDFWIFKQVFLTCLFYAFTAAVVSFIVQNYITEPEIQFGIRLLAIFFACVELMIFGKLFRDEHATGYYYIGDNLGGTVASICAIYILVLPLI